MSLSKIDLYNADSVRIDEGGRAIGFFCQKRPVHVNAEIVSELKKAADRYQKNVRLCLHDGPDAAFHEMVILERQGKYYRPHKHLEKGESYHILEGMMGAFAFDDQGQVRDACVLKPDGNFIYRVEVNMYHAVMPLSEEIIYHESKPGPFLGDNDSIFPDWAPDGTDEQETVAYVQKLKQYLDID